MVIQKAEFSGQPYRPSAIHAFYRWVDRLPGPSWLFYAAVLFVPGLLDNLVAWTAGVLPYGQINLYYLLTSAFIAFYLVLNDVLIRAAKQSLAELQPILGEEGPAAELVMFEFTHVPARASSVFFVGGLVMGAVLGVMQAPTSPEMNQAFLALEVPVFTLTMGFMSFSIYVVARAFVLVKRIFDNLQVVDIFDQGSIYAMSRYSGILVVFTAIAIYMGFALAPSLVANTYAVWVPLNAGVGLLVLAIFFLPLRAVNVRLTREKRRLLKEVSLRMKAAFDQLHKKIDEHDLEAIVELRESVEALKAEKEYLEGIRTWPWRPSTLRGVLTAVVLPVVIAILVEMIKRLITF